MLFIYPMAAMVAYILIIGIINFRTRFTGYFKGDIKLGYFRTLDKTAYEVPEFVVRAGRHYDNQFELPILYLVSCLTAASIGIDDVVALSAAWAFIASRLGHSYYHLGSNHIGKRAAWFFAGWLCLIVLWCDIVLVASMSQQN